MITLLPSSMAISLGSFRDSWITTKKLIPLKDKKLFGRPLANSYPHQRLDYSIRLSWNSAKPFVLPNLRPVWSVRSKAFVRQNPRVPFRSKSPAKNSSKLMNTLFSGLRTSEFSCQEAMILVGKDFGNFLFAHQRSVPIWISSVNTATPLPTTESPYIFTTPNRPTSLKMKNIISFQNFQTSPSPPPSERSSAQKLQSLSANSWKPDQGFRPSELS